MRKSWHLNRRIVLRGAGVAIALPWLEAMSWAAPADRQAKRAVFLYFPNGCYTPTWYPKQEGAGYELSPALESLARHKSDMTVMRGLNLNIKGSGHNCGDYWLSCANGFTSANKYANGISVDQEIAQAFANQTRFPSLVMCNDAGVGEQYRAHTQSYDAKGRAIPSQSHPQQIFARLFTDDGASREEKQRAFAVQHSILDAVTESASSLKRGLGRRDQQKLDEYLTSVREIERRVQQSEKWIDIPKPKVDASRLKLQATVEEPIAYVDTMLDIIFLALKTDTSRVAAYMLSREQYGSMQNLTSRLGISDRGHHDISHAGHSLGKQWTQVDQFFTGRFGHFLDRLKSFREADGTLLDNTLVAYGGGNSTKHNCSDLPTILAGGNAFGLKHGRHLHMKGRPLADLWLTLLHQLGMHKESFGDSRGEISELLNL